MQSQLLAQYINNAHAANARGEFNTAADLCQHAIKLSANVPEAWYNLGIALSGLGKRREALKAFEKSRINTLDSADAQNSIGLQLIGLRAYPEAEKCLKRALVLAPGYSFAHSNLGKLREKQKRYEEAEAACRKAIELQPSFSPLYTNLGAILNDQKRYKEAEQVFSKAIELDPDSAEAKFNLSLLLLSQGRYAEAWPYYESRYDPNRQQTLQIPKPGFPQWQGEPLTGKSLLICPEQGFGDYVQFARYVPLLKDRGASRITVLCDPLLKPLLETVEGADAVITDRGSVTPHDYWSFPLSIPMHFGTTVDTIPASLPYLHASADRIEYWQDRLPLHGFRVGLVWKGSPNLSTDDTRSLPGLATLAPLWSVPGVTFVSLQKGPGEDEAKHPPAKQPIIDLGKDIRDFADTAAIVSLLDLVICVDTAVVHVAGALGKPCWLLLPGIEVDWRWFLDRADSPWYPEVLRIFRQTKLNDWGDTISKAASELKAVAKPA